MDATSLYDSFTLAPALSDHGFFNQLETINRQVGTGLNQFPSRCLVRELFRLVDSPVS
jgi:hypothetical protein